MMQFQPAGDTWWRKPLVLLKGRHIPAELAVLSLELNTGECGVWLNSRGVNSGVIDLIATNNKESPTYKSRRISLPLFVSNMLAHIYKISRIKKGVPDLVIWNEHTKRIRFIEVKCAHWDSPSKEQEQIMKIIKSLDVSVSIVEWEKNTAQPAAAGDLAKAQRENA
jgi:hypothetical protein